MNNKQLTILFFLLFMCFHLHGQTWIRTFGDSASTYDARRIHETYDKGYLLTGIKSLGSTYLGWTLKLNINGYQRWSKYFGSIGKNNGFAGSVNTVDGGQIFIGGSNFIAPGRYDPFIVKTNACGEKEWCKIFNSTNPLACGNDIALVSSGGYMALLQNWVDEDVWVFRTNDTGEIIWTQQYVTDPKIFWSPLGRTIYHTTDDSFIITGEAYSPDSLTPGNLLLKIFLLKINVNGDILFEIPWGSGNGIISNGQGSIENKKHDLYTAGRRENALPPYEDYAALLKTSSSGHSSGFKDLQTNSQIGLATTINWFRDSTLVFGTAWRFNGIDTTIAVKTDSLGNILKIKTLFPNSRIYCYGSDITFDNKLILAGPKYSSPLSYGFKLNSNLEFDSIYNRPFTYDSLCPHPIVSDTIPLDDCVVVTSIYDPQKEPEKSVLHVYPNPAKSNVTIEFPQYLVRLKSARGINATTTYYMWESTTLEIYDMFGKNVFTKEISHQTQRIELDVSSWHTGMYIARVFYDKDKVAEEKFLVGQ